MNDFDLQKIANIVRLEVLRVSGTTSGGHLGGTFSCIDILVNLYFNDYFSLLKPDLTQHAKNDRFILSKGHACLAYYAILYLKGLISRDELYSFGTNGGLGAQLDTDVPFVDWNTGSLGHSIGVCSGFALASKLDNDHRYHAITLIGDSELAEGSTWESIAFCGDLKLSKVIVIVDRNRLSVTTRLEEDSIYFKLKNKIELFGWDLIEIDGHSQKDISKSLLISKKSSKPTMILANTIKGKGVSFMENNAKWHHGRPTSEEICLAEKELLKLINGEST